MGSTWCRSPQTVLEIRGESELYRTKKEFDSSVGRDAFSFTLGSRAVIKGWDLALRSMCVGEVRSITVPPEEAFGNIGLRDLVPGGATLRYTVELVRIGEMPQAPNFFKEIDHGLGNDDGKVSYDELQRWFRKNHGQDAPADALSRDDRNGDGVLSCDEFTGPKGICEVTRQHEL